MKILLFVVLILLAGNSFAYINHPTLPGLCSGKPNCSQCFCNPQQASEYFTNLISENREIGSEFDWFTPYPDNPIWFYGEYYQIESENTNFGINVSGSLGNEISYLKTDIDKTNNQSYDISLLRSDFVFDRLGVEENSFEEFSNPNDRIMPNIYLSIATNWELSKKFYDEFSRDKDNQTYKELSEKFVQITNQVLDLSERKRMVLELNNEDIYNIRIANSLFKGESIEVIILQRAKRETAEAKNAEELRKTLLNTDEKTEEAESTIVGSTTGSDMSSGESFSLKGKYLIADLGFSLPSDLTYTQIQNNLVFLDLKNAIKTISDFKVQKCENNGNVCVYIGAQEMGVEFGENFLVLGNNVSFNIKLKEITTENNKYSGTFNISGNLSEDDFIEKTG